MKYLLLLITFSTASFLQADLISCDQQQTVCEAQCKATSLVTDKNENTCSAQCLGERTACELEQSKETAAKLAEKAKENSQSLLEKAKAFWDGLSGK
ncbi:hypothetical protein [Endozoicomonas ascidiicola]|uniref:hypothetical protein n=1 Tax=Endozoicomonas ascidiicola TaxID=1698521 RepID=UPI00082B01D8|nr:hypothetical protein [Endozoicomonas ascidiicola]